MKSVPNNKNWVAATAGCNQEATVRICIKTTNRISLRGKIKLIPASVSNTVANISIHTWPVNIFMTFDFFVLLYSSITPTCALTKNTCNFSCCDSLFEIFINPTELSQPNDHWISYLNPKYKNFYQFWKCINISFTVRGRNDFVGNLDMDMSHPLIEIVQWNGNHYFYPY